MALDAVDAGMWAHRHILESDTIERAWAYSSASTRTAARRSEWVHGDACP